MNRSRIGSGRGAGFGERDVNGLFTLHGPAKLSCDVLIIGSGAGGSAAAVALVAAGRDVLLLEEGPYVPAERAPEGLSRAMPQMWRGGGFTAALGRPPIAFAEGRCVGGGTEINSAIFQRAPTEVLANWRMSHGLAGFDDCLTPYYERVSRMVSAGLADYDPGPPTEILRTAGERMGWRVTALERAQSRCIGTNQCSAACPTGAKQSVTTAILPGLLRKGLRLIAGCRVQRLIVRRGRVEGVVASVSGGRRLEVSCREVFLCAGATQSPALLQRSGLGPSIAPFQLHPTLRLLARFRQPVSAAEHPLPQVAITEFMPDLRFGGSIFTLGSFGMALAEDWAERSHLAADHRHFGLYYAMIRPRGAGRLRAVPGLPEPLVGYRLADEDWGMLTDGATALAEGLFSAGADLVLPSIAGVAPSASPSQFKLNMAGAARARAALMTIHIFSSLPMSGRHDRLVDPEGRLEAMKNVRVADASVIPEPLGVNPQATVMSLALRTAESFLASDH
jgi:choline dehydrogenase-like flavoprotein